MKRVPLLIVMLAFSGCSAYRYNGPPALPPYIHKIAVRAFTNHTQQFGLEDPLTVAVLSEFNRDGRYQITSEDQADGVVKGEITRYLLEAMSYDANHVPTEYKLSLVVTVSFYDKVKSMDLWTEPDMRGELRYFVASSGLAGAMSETDARQVIYDELSRDIRTRTLEGLGGGKETGRTTETESSTGTYVAPAVDNNPPPMPSPEPPPSPGRLPY